MHSTVGMALSVKLGAFRSADVLFCKECPMILFCLFMFEQEYPVLSTSLPISLCMDDSGTLDVLFLCFHP